MSLAIGKKSSSNLAAVGGIQPVSGIDLDPKRLEVAAEAYLKNGFREVDFLEADITDPGFETDYTASIVTCTDVLEHLVRPEIAVQRIYDLSERFAIMASPNEPNFRLTTLAATLTRSNYPQRWEYIKRLGLDPEHLQKFSKKTFEELICDNGFKVVDYQQTFLNRWNVVLAEKV